MADYKLSIIDPKAGKSYNRQIKEDHAQALAGHKIGDKISGDAIGLTGYEFEITGGSDTCGFPMRKDVHGPVKKRILVSKRAIGYKPRRKGEKRRKTVRGNEITFDMTLINLKILKYGETELFKTKE